MIHNSEVKNNTETADQLYYLTVNEKNLLPSFAA